MGAGMLRPRNEDHIPRAPPPDRGNRLVRDIQPFRRREPGRLVHQPEDHFIAGLEVIRQPRPEIQECTERHLTRTDGIFLLPGVTFEPTLGVIVRVEDDRQAELAGMADDAC